MTATRHNKVKTLHEVTDKLVGMDEDYVRMLGKNGKSRKGLRY